MPKLKPYKYWTRDKIHDHCIVICGNVNAYDMLIELNNIIFDNRWNPMEDYNGCSLIQDPLHPYPPCLIHDFRWLVEGGGLKYDLEFRRNLISIGESNFNATIKFLGVRCAWLLYF